MPPQEKYIILSKRIQNIKIELSDLLNELVDVAYSEKEIKQNWLKKWRESNDKFYGFLGRMLLLENLPGADFE